MCTHKLMLTFYRIALCCLTGSVSEVIETQLKLHSSLSFLASLTYKSHHPVLIFCPLSLIKVCATQMMSVLPTVSFSLRKNVFPCVFLKKKCAKVQLWSLDPFLAEQRF